MCIKGHRQTDYQNSASGAKWLLAPPLSHFHGLNSPTTVYPVSAPAAFPIVIQKRVQLVKLIARCLTVAFTQRAMRLHVAYIFSTCGSECNLNPSSRIWATLCDFNIALESPYILDKQIVDMPIKTHLLKNTNKYYNWYLI